MGITQFVWFLGLGFLLGLKHSVDADHVVAVSSLVAESKSIVKASILGAVWGIGHSITLLLVGLAVLIFKLTIPQRLALGFEFLVGVMLVILGIGVLVKLKGKRHFHAHSHDKLKHSHFHKHEGKKHNHFHRPLMVGMVHGLAGSAALMLVILATVKSLIEGVLYILIFSIGLIVGMLITSGVLGVPLVIAGRRERLEKGVKLVSGILSVGLGTVMMYKIGLKLY